MKKILLSVIIIMSLLMCSCTPGGGDSSNSENEQEVTEKAEITLNDTSFITWYGRTDYENGGVWFDYTASGFQVKFRGTKLTMEFAATKSGDASLCPYITVIADGENYRTAPIYALDAENKSLTLEFENGEHTVKVLKRSEASQSRAKLNSVETDGVFLRAEERRERYIEVYGDSITCGYGNVDSEITDHFSTRTENGLATYGFIAAESLNAEASIVSCSGIAVKQNVWNGAIKLPELLTRKTYYNAGRYKAERNPQVVVINGGANDNTHINTLSGEKKEQAVNEFIAAYAEFLNALRAEYPGVKIICCTNMLGEGGVMGRRIQLAMEEAVYDEDLVFLSLPAMNSADGIGADSHPGYKTHEKAAEVLIETIKREMNW